MKFFRTVVWLTIVAIGSQSVSAQEKTSTTKDAHPIFGDLPIDDPSSNSILAANESPTKKIRENILVRGSLNKKTAYLGETLLLSYRLYSRLSSTSKLSTRPVLTNFSAEEIPVANDSTKLTTLDGKKYRMFNLLSIRLNPISEGHINIDPIVVDNDVVYVNEAGKNRHYSGAVSSNMVSILILPLPQNGKPAGFAGAVGKFDIHTTVDKNEQAAGDKNVLHVEIAGTGNFENMLLPPIQWPSSLDHFPAADHFMADEKIFPVLGKKTFDVPFVPKKMGEYLIPAMRLSAFDPDSKKYYESNSNPIILHIAASAIPDKDEKPKMAVKEDKTNSFNFVLIGLAALALMIAGYELIYIRRKKSGKLKEQVRMQEELAAASANAVPKTDFGVELARISKMESNSDFFGAIKAELTEMIQKSLGTEEISEERLISMLEEKSRDANLAQDIRSVYDHCSRQIYAPADGFEGRAGMLKNMGYIIDRLKSIT